jgi:hypothetical protein
MWQILILDDVLDWLDHLDTRSKAQVFVALELLEQKGPNLGRPLVDSIIGSSIKNLKELRPGSAGSTELRILFVFDPQRNAVLLVAGDKSKDFVRWYRRNIPLAEARYETYLKGSESE